MDRAAFISSLVEYAEQIDDVSPLETERDALWTRMLAGDGKTLTSTSVSGKAFMFQVMMSIEDRFAAFVQAIKIFNAAAGSSPFTFIDFSGG